MAVIDLGPSRWTQMGSNLGGGISQGLLRAILQEAEEQREREQIRQRFGDLQNILQGLGVQGQGAGILGQMMQREAPKTQTGLDFITKLISSEMEPPETYTLGPGQGLYRGAQMIAERPAAYTLGPGQGRYMGEKMIAERPAAEDPGSQSLVTQRQMQKYQNAIRTTMSKYDINPTLMQFLETTPEGGMIINYEKFREFQENPYQILRQKAASGDPRAVKDLKNVDSWMNKIIELAGGEPLQEDLPDYRTDNPFELELPETPAKKSKSWWGMFE